MPFDNYIVRDAAGEVDRAETLKDARHKLGTCVFGGAWTAAELHIVRLSDGRVFRA